MSRHQGMRRECRVTRCSQREAMSAKAGLGLFPDRRHILQFVTVPRWLAEKSPAPFDLPFRKLSAEAARETQTPKAAYKPGGVRPDATAICLGNRVPVSVKQRGRRYPSSFR